MPIDLELIRRVPLFADLPDAELRHLADSLRTREFPAGALLFREDDPSAECYIILAGEVAIIKALDTPDQRELGVRSAGTVIGELSLFSPGGRHTASVRAQSPLQLVAMTPADLEGLLSRNPRLAFGMVQTLSLRLIDSERSTIRDLREKNEALAQAYLELQAAQAQIVEKERLEREMEVARGIQRSLLPRVLPLHPGLDFGALMEPMSAVGGDFYDFVALDDGHLGIAVGDVSDHGVPAALFMAMTVTLLRSAARREATPADVLRCVNRGLMEFNSAGMFVTVLYGVLDYAAHEYRYARAGHEPPLLCAPVLDVPVVSRRHSALRRGQLLGIVDEPELDEQTLPLPPGSTLLLYTDGSRETSNPAGAMFDEAGLRRALAAAAHRPAQAVVQNVFEAAQAHRGLLAQQDDITLVAVRVADQA